jgi:hypothetical protein
VFVIIELPFNRRAISFSLSLSPESKEKQVGTRRGIGKREKNSHRIPIETQKRMKKKNADDPAATDDNYVVMT